MSIKPRRKRSDSASVAILAAANAAAGALNPPAHVALPVGARPFWDAVIANRQRSQWNDADLAHAAVLARCQYDVDRFQRTIDKEGDVVKGKIHPLHKQMEILARRAISLARMLHVHPEATEGRSRDAGNGLTEERKARTAKRDHGDDLIPRAH